MILLSGMTVWWKDFSTRGAQIPTSGCRDGLNFIRLNMNNFVSVCMTLQELYKYTFFFFFYSFRISSSTMSLRTLENLLELFFLRWSICIWNISLPLRFNQNGTNALTYYLLLLLCDNITGLLLREADDSAQRDWAFGGQGGEIENHSSLLILMNESQQNMLTCSPSQVVFTIMYRRENMRQYELRADTVHETNSWIDAIKMAR